MTLNYEAGQVWKYKNRESENDSRLIILHIDNKGSGDEIIHIAVHNLKNKNSETQKYNIDCISHMPFSKAAIDESVIELEGHTEIPDYSEGYNIWKESYDKGEAGVYSISVSEAVDL